jgi:hypothetical protein
MSTGHIRTRRRGSTPQQAPPSPPPPLPYSGAPPSYSTRADPPPRMPPAALLRMSDDAATYARRRCYIQSWALLRTGDGAATYGRRRRCYRRYYCCRRRWRGVAAWIVAAPARRQLSRLQGQGQPGRRQCTCPRSTSGAPSDVGDCYNRRRRLLQAEAAVASKGGGSCYHRRRRLLQGATPAATWGIAGCHHRRRRLLHGATSVATWGIAGCYMRPWWRLLQMASTFSGGNLWARGVAAMGFGVAALVPGQQLARCC